MIVVLISIVILLLAAIIFYWRWSHKPVQRLVTLNTRVIKISRRKIGKPNESLSLLRDIYKILNNCLLKGDQVSAYKAVDLLKLMFAEKLWRADEPLRLTGIVVAALRVKQPDIASLVLDTFRPMLRNTDATFIPQICEQLSLISTIALKQKQNFLVDKTAEHVFYILDNPLWSDKFSVTDAALKTLKVIGMAALKKHNAAFLREIGMRLLSLQGITNETAVSLTNVLGSWMRQIVKYNDMAAFNELSGTVEQLFFTERLKGADFILLLNDWKDFTGTAALNPDKSMAAAITNLMLLLGIELRNIRLWMQTVKCVVEVIKIALSREEWEDAFPLIQVVMESGRKIMLSLRHGHSFDAFSPQALYILIQECVLLTEYIARGNMTSNAGDVILNLFQKWKCSPAAQIQTKSIRKFCQLLLIYWQYSKKRQAKRSAADVKDLAEPSLITDADRQILGL